MQNYRKKAVQPMVPWVEGMRNMGIHQFISIENCMNALKVHMENDEPEKPGSYAHGWHCNIAMACYDSIPEDSELDRHKVGNEAASRFMRLCFGVETKA